MLRLGRRRLPALALAVTAPAWAEPAAPVLRPDPSRTLHGPAAARGAVVWVHPARPAGSAGWPWRCFRP